ncbi:MAG TPA: phosphate ABC transporter substrate-binding protein [Gammaproteobacteria bacterium]|nr:phosphate ABC transporter substrate-binding protein [Gammaproteobacteria bacterium]
MRLRSVVFCFSLYCSAALAAERPNILWIDIDDQSPWYGVYGDQLASTPNLDVLASEGVAFERVYVATPVCAPSRSAMITGVYPIRAGTHDMRSGRVPEYQVHLPDEITTLPELLRAAGYETFNAHKDDYNFTYDRRDLYTIGNPPHPYSPGSRVVKDDGAGVADDKIKGKKQSKGKGKAPNMGSWKGMRGSGSWRDVKKGPFFGQISIPGGKGVAKIEEELRARGIEPIDPADVRVPSQYPDIPQVRQHVTDHYNSILRTDHRVGELIQQFKDDGVWGNTVFILYSDHGSDLPRSKEFVYEEGLHVPFIVSAPGMDLFERGNRALLVNLMDIAATTLGLAGVDVPEFMDAKDIFAEDFHRDYVYSSADRMSNVIDRTRSVMGKRFHYIRNFLLDRPLYNWGHREMGSSLGDPDGKFTSFMAMRKLADAGKLTGVHAAPYGKRVAEELYDLEADPDEVVNLAGNPAYRQQLERMRNLLTDWIIDTDDKGQYQRSPGAMKEILGRFPKEWLQSPEFSHY